MTDRSRPRTKLSWVCPRCGRRFVKQKQAHSCRVHSIEDHFHGKSAELRSVFDALLRALKRRGPIRVDAVESTINLASNFHFGGIAVRREYLRIGFVLDREIHDERIARVERIGPHRLSHQVHVRSLGELDARLLGWLAEAQALQARPGVQGAG